MESTSIDKNPESGVSPGNLPESDNKKTWWKHWGVVLALAAVAAFVVWALIKAGPWLREWQGRRAADALRRQTEEQMRNDKYGGTTPEETFDLFIAALEKGDVELASKYFVINKQEQWRKTLEEYKNQNLLVDFRNELISTSKKWRKTNASENLISFKYQVLIDQSSTANFNGQKVIVPAGNYTNETIFQKYPNDIWKISVL